jgi:hypothetical protein
MLNVEKGSFFYCHSDKEGSYFRQRRIHNTINTQLVISFQRVLSLLVMWKNKQMPMSNVPSIAYGWQ